MFLKSSIVPIEKFCMDKPVILIVDDQEIVRNFVRLAIQQLGFEVQLAASGKAAHSLKIGHYGAVR